jgi:putative ABC transport system permease protein
MEKNILIRLNNTSAQNLKIELSKYSNITSVAAASHVPAAGTSYGNGYKQTLDDPEWINMGYFLVDEDYLTNMNVKLLAGRFYTEENKDLNQDYIVINQQAVKKFNFNSEVDAVGQELIQENDSTKRTIIGVIADYNHRDLLRELSPMALRYDPTRFNLLQVAYVGSYEQAADNIEKAWAIVNPDLKIDYESVESEVKSFYEILFGDIVSVLTVIASLAILISCLGLLGMATYTTETRLKEISIRKILGSSNPALIALLSKGYVKLLLLSIVIAVPLAFFANNFWLQLIAYHTSFDVTIVGIGVLVLLIFGILTIGSQTIRATFINPVENLKND